MDFEEFAADRLPALTRYAIMLVGSREPAEDLVQDALVKTHAKWGRISTLDRPDLYVKRIVTNEFLSWRRRRRVSTVELEPDFAEVVRADRPPSHEESSADREALWAELARLPRQQRAVLVLRFYEGLNDNEIATVLDCRPGTVRGYGSRALATLRIDLAGWRQSVEEDR
ncbi:MAG: SigE family RNA polymerase sigma factor [Geodermatophilaceae bacterium]|nr:SigE family RNA polymerase sigma factor [Geodermatophilaceae bacterium]